jgi:integrase
MAILQQCPICKRLHSLKLTECPSPCGENLKKAARSKRIKYFIHYRLPTGKQIKQLVGKSIEEARAADGKRKAQKREGRIFDMVPDSKVTFHDLTQWYLGLDTTKDLKGFKAVKVYLDKFNREYGSTLISNVKVTDLQSLRGKRKKEGRKPKTIDHEIETMKRVIWAAFRDEKVSGDVLRTFQSIKKLTKAHSNRRNRVLTVPEYQTLEKAAPGHLKGILAMGYWAGMRKGEIINLTWDRVNLKERTINLKAEDTKDEEARTVPIGDNLLAVLSKIPKALHDNHIFLYQGEPITKRFETAIKSACRKAGILWGREKEGGFIFHDLRHTFVTDARKAGVDRTVRMAITGHAIKDMDQRYDVVDLVDLHQAIKKLETFRANVTLSLQEANSEGTK